MIFRSPDSRNSSTLEPEVRPFCFAIFILRFHHIVK